MSPIIILFSILICNSVEARDFGTFGNTFPVKEQNLLEYLQERLIKASPEELEIFSKKQIQNLKEPKSLNLPNAKLYRTSSFDPSVTVSADIVDHEGKVVVMKGSRFNPLSLHSFKDLIFLDGSQKSHLQWAKENDGIWVLVRGSPTELEEQEGRKVYFDQFGSLTQKFKITALPAKVSQNGMVLKIEEFPLESKL